MTLEQFAARVQSIAGNEHCVARIGIRFDPYAIGPRYFFEAYTDSAGWVGIREQLEDPEEVLCRLEKQQDGSRRTDPMEAPNGN